MDALKECKYLSKWNRFDLIKLKIVSFGWKGFFIKLILSMLDLEGKKNQTNDFN